MDGGVINRSSASQSSDMEVEQDQSEGVGGAKGGSTLDGNADDGDSSDNGSVDQTITANIKSNDPENEHDYSTITDAVLLRVLHQVINRTLELAPGDQPYNVRTRTRRYMD